MRDACRFCGQEHAVASLPCPILVLVADDLPEKHDEIVGWGLVQDVLDAYVRRRPYPDVHAADEIVDECARAVRLRCPICHGGGIAEHGHGAEECRGCREEVAIVRSLKGRFAVATAASSAPPTGFYVLDGRPWPGSDAASFWRQARSGYTANLDEAGVYSESEAKEIERLRGTDTAVPCVIARRLAKPTVSVDRLRAALVRAGSGR